MYNAEKLLNIKLQLEVLHIGIQKTKNKKLHFTIASSFGLTKVELLAAQLDFIYEAAPC